MQSQPGEQTMMIDTCDKPKEKIVPPDQFLKKRKKHTPVVDDSLPAQAAQPEDSEMNGEKEVKEKDRDGSEFNPEELAVAEEAQADLEALEEDQ